VDNWSHAGIDWRLFFSGPGVVELWHRCLRRLEGEIPSKDLSTYLRPLQPHLQDKHLVLLAPNKLVLNRVRQDFLPAIKKGLSALAGDEAPSVDVSLTAPRGEAGTPAAPVNGGAHAPEPPARSEGGKLDAKYTFEAFIEGKSNAQARAYALRVAEAPGGEFNPLLIYGESGLGKTHLMHAIGNRLRSKNAKARVLYVVAERC
jgi:chromosomal replication initiator protein